MISTQPANMQKNLPEEMTIQERDMKRSEIRLRIYKLYSNNRVSI